MKQHLRIHPFSFHTKNFLGQRQAPDSLSLPSSPTIAPTLKKLDHQAFKGLPVKAEQVIFPRTVMTLSAPNLVREATMSE